MTRWLHLLLRNSDVASLLAQAKAKSCRAIWCVSCGWHDSAETLRTERDMLIWAARELAMRPSKRRPLVG